MTIKVLSFTLISASLVIFLKDKNKELSLFISLISSCFLLILFSEKLFDIFDDIKSSVILSGATFIYFESIFKALGLSVLSKFVSDFCKETGEITLSENVLLAGRISVLIVFMPFIKDAAQILKEILFL